MAFIVARWTSALIALMCLVIHIVRMTQGVAVFDGVALIGVIAVVYFIGTIIFEGGAGADD